MAPLSFILHFFTHWQVKLPSLHDYLLSMRRSGYALVGAEQTANSKDIVNFNFRPNTILVLGYVSLYFYSLLTASCSKLLLEAIVSKMLGCGILRTTYNWGEPERAPHKQYICAQILYYYGTSVTRNYIPSMAMET